MLVKSCSPQPAVDKFGQAFAHQVVAVAKILQAIVCKAHGIGMTLAVLLPGALVRFELGAELLLSSALAHAPKSDGSWCMHSCKGRAIGNP